VNRYTIMESCNEDLPGWLIYKDEEVDYHLGPFYTRADAITKVIELNRLGTGIDEA
jgi:hypothetical protein